MPPTATGTRFRARVLSPLDSSVLSSGHNNVKLGRDVRKGRLFRGYWIFSIALEERATCPTTCPHWTDCYGNNMHLAKRIDHSDEELLWATIVREVLEQLSVRGRRGVLLRLHTLGDFYSPDYVEFWSRLLDRLPRLACFGYTAHRSCTPTGRAIARAKLRHGRRFAIRWSDEPEGGDRAVTIASQEDCPPDAFVCPEQTGRTRACATCAACWEGTRSVAFLQH